MARDVVGDGDHAGLMGTDAEALRRGFAPPDDDGDL